MSLMIYEKGVSASHFSKTYLLKWDFFLLFLVKGEEIMENSSTVLYIQKDWTGKFGKFGKLEQGKKKKGHVEGMVSLFIIQGLGLDGNLVFS